MALVIGALEACAPNFGCRELFGCLKTGLTGLAWDEIDRLENYAITWKIHGAAWERDWVEHPDGYGIPVDEAAQGAAGRAQRAACPRHRAVCRAA